MRAAILTTIILLAFPTLAQDSTDDCKELPCQIVIGPKLLSLDEANKQLIDLAKVRDEVGLMIGITTCEKCTVNGITPTLEAATMLLYFVDVIASKAEALAKDAVEGIAVKVSDQFSLNREIYVLIPDEIAGNSNPGQFDPVVEVLFFAAQDRALRAAAVATCRTNAILSEDPEYLSEVETSCHDRQDNDCDGLADCGFMGVDFEYQSDPDCACD